MADCDNDQECEKIVPTPIKPEPLPKQCSGGGESGEGTNDFNELDNRPKYDGRRMTGDTNIPAYSNFTGTDGQSDGTAGLVPAPATTDAGKFLKSDGTWAEAGGGGGSSDFIRLTDADTNYTDPDTGEEYIALWLLPTGRYALAEDTTTGMVLRLVDGAISEVELAENRPVAFITNYGEGSSTDILLLSSVDSIDATVEYDTGISNDFNAISYQFAGTDGVGDGTAGLVPAPTAFDANKFLKSDGSWGNPGGPVPVWEVDGEVVTTGLVAVGEDISANPNWQLTNLDLTPYKRIKIFTKAAQKAGTTASASTTPAMVLEMSLDPRAAIAEYGGNYVGSMIAQKPNDANRLCTLTCAVSADKTKFEVLRMTNLYGTAATSNSDVNAYVFKIEGYYD